MRGPERPLLDLRAIAAADVTGLERHGYNRWTGTEEPRSSIPAVRPPSSLPATSALSLARIEQAARAIDPAFRDTPQFVADGLGRQLGLSLVVKVETVNPIRCFKGRGAGYFVSCLSGSPRLVCASAGNFGQGLAYAAARRGLALTVFAAREASPLKLERIRELGAEVRLAGDNFDAAKEAARAFAGEAGALFVEDGREPAITEGAGTIGLELERSGFGLDAVLVPLGNGALVNGIGCWLKAQAPATRVIGVAAAGAPAMARSFLARRPLATESVSTLADGIAVRVPVPEAVAEMLLWVDEVLTVDDQTIVEAMRLLHRELGLVVEPAGAAGVAAALAHRERFAGTRIATPLCGGNLTAAQVRRWLL